jgi:NADPH:quinone reductase-like Zn-dependent oxidoreductase
MQAKGSEAMKAAIYRKYGPADVVEIGEADRPQIKDDEVLVEVAATTVTTADWRFRASAFPGIMWPLGRLIAGVITPRNKILGGEFAGRVVERGPKVTRFDVGDDVFGFSGARAHAEYLAVRADGPVARKPPNLSYEEAAAAPFGGQSALAFLRDFAKVKPGQKVLIGGASGGVGVFAVQLAKHFGAEVTGVCSGANVELVRSLGADHVIDYTKDDFAASGATYDLILDTAGTMSFSRARPVLSPTGIFLPIEFGGREIGQALLKRLTGGQKVMIGISSDNRENIEALAALLESGAIRPVIDARFAFDEIAEAHRRVESRHKRGSVVIMVRQQG